MVGGGPSTLICMRLILLDSDASCCAAGRSMKIWLSSSLPAVMMPATLQVTFSVPVYSLIYATSHLLQACMVSSLPLSLAGSRKYDASSQFLSAYLCHYHI